MTKDANSQDVNNKLPMEMASFSADDLKIKQFKPASLPSPLLHHGHVSVKDSHFVQSGQGINMDIRTKPGRCKGLSLEKSGARKQIYFDPATTRVALVTCGGLCPGLNDVIRGIVNDMHYWYGVSDVWGIRFGYNGLSSSPLQAPVRLTPESVSDIHLSGGTILGSSRGFPGVEDVVDNLVKQGIDILFCIGGDGTLRGANVIAREIERRKLKISIVGIPKTIDNDVPFVYRSFGFRTAVEKAKEVIECAHTEAKGQYNGIGLVKIMGRDAGFLAARATHASGDVNFCLIPEMNFDLHGSNGIMAHLREHFKKHHHHAVIVVAEGAGQKMVGATDKKDASGNVKYNDIGVFLKREIKKSFAKWDEKVEIKYIDPSYIVRSVRANSMDNIYCSNLARYAVDAAMSGRTDMMVGYWHGEFVNVPLTALEGVKKRVSPDSQLWMGVLASTRQPLEWW